MSKFFALTAATFGLAEFKITLKLKLSPKKLLSEFLNRLWHKALLQLASLEFDLDDRYVLHCS